MGSVRGRGKETGEFSPGSRVSSIFGDHRSPGMRSYVGSGSGSGTGSGGAWVRPLGSGYGSDRGASTSAGARGHSAQGRSIASQESPWSLQGHGHGQRQRKKHEQGQDRPYLFTTSPGGDSGTGHQGGDSGTGHQGTDTGTPLDPFLSVGRGSGTEGLPRSISRPDVQWVASTNWHDKRMTSGGSRLPGHGNDTGLLSQLAFNQGEGRGGEGGGSRHFMDAGCEGQSDAHSPMPSPWAAQRVSSDGSMKHGSSTATMGRGRPPTHGHAGFVKMQRQQGAGTRYQSGPMSSRQ